MFVIADPAPESEVDFYEVEIMGAITRSDPERENGMVRLKHELPEDMPDGENTVQARPVNEWGEGP